MNHKWCEQETEQNAHVEITGTSFCYLCGLKRSKIKGFGYYYKRSGMHFADQKPDCIDWEAENKKTID